MKNIQIIYAALNCAFSTFEAKDEESALLFSASVQEILSTEDLAQLPAQEEITAALSRIWERPIRHRDVHAIHRTLFYVDRYKSIYREKRVDGVDPQSVNAAQRRLCGI
jgi:hypothetical protein